MPAAMTRRRLALNLMSSERLGDGSFSAILDNARLADEMGVDVLVLPDHLAIHETAHAEPGSTATRYRPRALICPSRSASS